MLREGKRAYRRTPLILCVLAWAALAGCGGGGSSDPAVGLSRSGVAVDPYVEGAVFQEVDRAGALLQPESTPSDGRGRFRFPLPVQPGSLVEMKTTARGVHAGAPFEGLLRRAVQEGDPEPLVVSPLTTLIANGVPAEELLEALSGAGLVGMRMEDLTADPMAGLSERTGAVTEDDLRLLHANMAVQALLSVTGDPDLGPGALEEPDTVLLLEDLMFAVRATLNPSVCADLALEAGTRSEQPFTLGDAVQVAARLQRQFIADFRGMTAGNAPPAEGAVDAAVAAVMGDAGAMARAVYEARVGAVPGAPGGPQPGPGPGQQPGSDPAQPDGMVLYDASCALCHRAGSHDASGFAPDLSGKGAAVPPKLQAGHQGMSLSGAEVAALAGWLDGLAAPGTPHPPPPPPTAGDCTSCHGQPPSGTVFPNTRGAHAAHAALPTVGADCTVCHLGAMHNGFVDLAFPAAYDGRRGPATDNRNGTCSTVSCHGGQTTPDWWTGSIAVETQCRSCHQAGTTEYNGYSSGRHSFHVQTRGYDCTACHSTARLAGVHFAGLDTPTLEGAAASTLGGAGTRVTAYNAGTRTCTTSCHGSERWQ